MYLNQGEAICEEDLETDQWEKYNQVVDAEYDDQELLDAMNLQATPFVPFHPQQAMQQEVDELEDINYEAYRQFQGYDHDGEQ